MLAPISPPFALVFPITFPTQCPISFWTIFGPQIDFKIDQKSVGNFFKNQATNKSYFSFIFDQIPKTISCSSKMVDVQKSFQNLVFLQLFQTSAHANKSKHATCNAFKNHQKPNPKSMNFSLKLNEFSIIFGIDFQVRNSDVLGKVLGSILASISDHVGVQNDVRTASKNHHIKSCQHEPQHDPKRPPKTASWIGVVVGVEVQDRRLTAFMPNKPSWIRFWHHVGPFFDRFWTVAGSS